MKNILLNTLKKMLKVLAKLTLWRYKPTIVGITGNVGKTSTKESASVVLGHAKRVRSSPKSFNNELGLPLTILGDWQETGGLIFWIRVLFRALVQILVKLPHYPEILVLEYGVDRPGDMSQLLKIARPKVGIVTAIGDIPVHVEFFAGKEAVAREKAKLINQLPSTGFAILNADDVTVYEMRDKTRARVLTFGFSEIADMRIMNFETTINDTIDLDFKIFYGGSFIPVHIEQVVGRAQGYAAAATACVGLVFSMNLVQISESMDGYKSPPGRLKILSGIKGSKIIDDTYNASPLAMEEALDSLKHIEAKQKIAVLGDMLEIGKYTLEAHHSIGQIAAKSTDILITIGMRGKFIGEGALEAGMSQKNIFHFDNLEEAGMFLQGRMQKGSLVLVKGSQGVRMEKIVKEVMYEPQRAKALLVRQEKRWLEKKGTYE